MLNINERMIIDTDINFENKIDYSNKDIMDLFEHAVNYIKEQKKQQIEKFHEFKMFLGQKKEKDKIFYYLEKEEIYLKNNFFQNIEKIKRIKVSKDSFKNYLLLIDGEKVEDSDKLIIYNMPIMFIEIFESNLANISVISDNKALEKEYNILNQYKYKMLSLNNESEIIRISNVFEMQNLIKSINIENEHFIPYLTVLECQIPKIQDSDLELENIYKKVNDKEKESILVPNEISSIFFYYFNIGKDLQKNYKFINSYNRKNLFNIIHSFIFTYQSNNNILILLGPKGIGKTTSLVNISFSYPYNIFYFNLELFQRYKNDQNQIKELKIQVLKLFHDIIPNKELLKAKEEIMKLIDNEYSINSMEFIYKIIEIFNNSLKELEINMGNFCFMIDQFQFSYISDKNRTYNIHKIICLVQSTKYIKLIMCPNINNKFSKDEYNNLLENKLSENLINIYYFQEFIDKRDMIKNILNEESEEDLQFMEEVGYLPKLFYDSKKYSIKSSYKEILKTNLKKNLDIYLDKNNNIDNDKILLNLLDLIVGEKLICSSVLKEKISELPLKYLKLIKYKVNKNQLKELEEKINLNNRKNKDILLTYLKLLFKLEDNQEFDSIINQYFYIEEKDIKDYIDNYIERDNNSKNIYGNYYESFITENIKSSYRNINIEEIYLFKFELSMNLFIDVINERLYEDIRNQYDFFKDILDKEENGGFFELLVDYYIQTKKSFIVENIEKVYYISSIVPNNYSISYYSSKRKTNEFKKLELKKINKKKKIPFKNVYIRQILFNSKYYNMALLIKSSDDPKNNNFHLVSIQAIINKDPEKRMMKEEHELILGATKQNIENEFDIVIDDAYFVYVLKETNNKIEDENTQIDCDNNEIKYIGFNIEAIKDENINEKNKYIISLDNALITNSFLIHNSASLLRYDEEDMDYLVLKSGFIQFEFENNCRHA